MSPLENWKCIRGMWITSVSDLDYYFKEFHLLEKDYNIFISNATFDTFPKFTTDLKYRSNEMRSFFTTQYRESIKKFDLLLDLDFREDINLFETQKRKIISDISNLLNSFMISYTALNSSDNGFHFVIPFECMGKNFNVMNDEIFSYIKQFVINLKAVFYFCNMLDINGINNHTKIRKCPYSLVSDSVCFPYFTMRGFVNEHFDIDYTSTYHTVELLKIRTDQKLVHTFNSIIDISSVDRLNTFMKGLIEV